MSLHRSGSAPECPWNDAVLAHFLDGDALSARVVEDGWERDAGPVELAEHRGDCDLCALALASARRLDALTASAAPTEVDPERATAWLDAAILEGEKARAPDLERACAPAGGAGVDREETVGAGRAVLLLGAVACVLFGVVLALFVARALRGDGERERPANVADAPSSPEADRAPASDTAVTARVAPSSDSQASGSPPPESSEDASVAEDTVVFERDGALVFPRRPTVLRVGASASADRQPSASTDERVGPAVPSVERLALSGASLDESYAAMAWLRARALGLPPAPDLIAELGAEGGDAVRRAALVEIRSAARSDHTVLPRIESVLRAWPRARVEAILAELRTDASLGRRIRDAVLGRQPSGVRVAAWIGGSHIDECLLQSVRGDVETADQIAVALAEFGRRPARAELLLGLARDARLQAAAGGEPALVRRWSTTQPAAFTWELLDVLRVSRNAGERRRCLLALAARRDVRATTALIELLDGSRLEEARLAAFALGCMPPGTDTLATRRVRRDELRLAALVCRRDPGIARRLDELPLTDEERAFLRGGAFSEHQLEVAAALLRPHRRSRVWDGSD